MKVNINKYVEDRFDWDKVYKHKLVSEHFKDYRS